MTSILATGNLPELLWPGIRAIFGNTYNDWKPLWGEFMDIEQSDKQFEKYQGMTNLGLVPVKDQGKAMAYDGVAQGFQREIQNVSYGLGSVVTREMMDYDQYNQIRKIPQQLGQACRKTEETVCANLLNNGFSTATASVQTLAADGLSYFNSAHLLVSSPSTYANQPSVASDLTQTSLEQAHIDISNYKDDRNLPIRAMARTLIVPTALQFQARRILETQYEVDSNNNAINPVATASMPLKIVVNPYLTDTDAWFLKTDVAEGLIFQESAGAEIDRDNDFDSKSLRFSIYRRFGVGGVDPRGWYGSPGA